MLEKTLVDNKKVRLNPQYVAIAGKDADNVPRIPSVTPQGELRTIAGGMRVPDHDEKIADYWDVGKTNLKTLTFKKGGNTVAVLTVTYVGGGTSANDVFLSAKMTYP